MSTCSFCFDSMQVEILKETNPQAALGTSAGNDSCEGLDISVAGLSLNWLPGCSRWSGQIGSSVTIVNFLRQISWSHVVHQWQPGVQKV